MILFLGEILFNAINTAAAVFSVYTSIVYKAAVYNGTGKGVESFSSLLLFLPVMSNH